MAQSRLFATTHARNAGEVERKLSNLVALFVNALKGVALHPELVLLRIMSRVDGVDSVLIKDERHTKH
jgi:hypothetical protein